MRAETGGSETTAIQCLSKLLAVILSGNKICIISQYFVILCELIRFFILLKLRFYSFFREIGCFDSFPSNSLFI